MNKPHKPPPSAYLRKLIRRRDAEFRRLKRRKISGFVAERMTPLEAITDWRYAAATAELLVATGMTALGRADLQCFGCCNNWRLARPPAAFVGIEFHPGGERVLAALCPDCCSEATIKAALERDFPGGPVRKVVHEPGSA